LETTSAAEKEGWGKKLEQLSEFFDNGFLLLKKVLSSNNCLNNKQKWW
jgi:hypothetical protein